MDTFDDLKQVDLIKYQIFVDKVTSAESKEHALLSGRLYDLESQENINSARMMMSAIGLGSETGEFQEIVKKCVFQGKPLDEETRFHMKRELGDIIWYWVNACHALGLNPNEVIYENVEKLKARYPGGEFDVHYSENRKEGDL